MYLAAEVAVFALTVLVPSLIALRDRNDNQIELTYDDAGHLVEVLDSAGRTVAVEPARNGRIASLHVRNAVLQGRWIAVALQL